MVALALGWVCGGGGGLGERGERASGVAIDLKLGRKCQGACRSKTAKIFPIGNPMWLPLLPS